MKKAYNTAESELPDFLSGDGKIINLSYRRLKSSDLKELFNKVENPDKVIELNLYDNRLTDISEIKRFKNLKRLYLDYNGNLEDISALQNLNNLKYLSLCYNKITDISALQNLNNLNTLDIRYNKITNILALENLIRLDVLDIGYNKITNISSLKNLIRLNVLNIGYNNIKDISALKNLKKLKSLNLNNLQLEPDQIKYIKDLKLVQLFGKGAFKSDVLKQLNKNVTIYL